jgi:hypothetical protein
MRKAIVALSAFLVLSLGLFVVSQPAWATTDDVAITVTPSNNGTALPSTLNFTIAAAVQSGSASMGGTVRLTFTSNVVTMITNDPECIQTGTRQIDCTFVSIPATATRTWYAQASTNTLGSGTFSLTAALLDSAPIDVVSGNNSDTGGCTSVLSVITGCA